MLLYLKRRRLLRLSAALAVLMGLAVLVTALRVIYPYPYRDTIVAEAVSNDLDPLFVAAVIHVESGFNPTARSPKGAVGLMQLMPSTAKGLAQQERLEYRPELLLDPKYNITLGTGYLAELRQEFGGSLPLTLAAYNGGRGRTKEWLAAGTWDGTLAGLSGVPFPETRNFISRVYRVQTIYRLLYGRGG